MAKFFDDSEKYTTVLYNSVTILNFIPFHFIINLDYKLRNKVLLLKIFKETFYNWEIYFNTPPEPCSCILSQLLWYNKYVWINKKTLNFKRLSDRNVNFVMDLLDNSGKIKSWNVLKMEYNLNHKFIFNGYN